MADDDTLLTWGDREWKLAEDAAMLWVKSVLSRYKVQVFWRDRPDNGVSEPSAELAFGDEVPTGKENVTEEGPNGELVTKLLGSYDVMFQVKIRTRNQSTFRMARRYAGILEQTLEHPYYEGILREGGLGLVEVEPVRAFPQKSADGTRWESIALLEVKFNIVKQLVDEVADESLGWVDTIDIAVGMDGNAPGPVRSIDVRPSVLNPPPAPEQPEDD